MDPAKNIVSSLFEHLLSSVTGGLITDLTTAMLCVGGFFLILFAVDIITKIITGTAPSQATTEWWEKTGEDAQYREYKKKRSNAEAMANRYRAEKIGKGDAEAGIAFLQKSNKERIK